MDIKQQILHYYRVDELSLREIARRTGVDRKTVTRLINAYEASIKGNPETGVEEFLASRPKYKERAHTPRSMTESIAGEIDKWLKENERRRNNGMRKQCLKGKDIQCICGFTGSPEMNVGFDKEGAEMLFNLPFTRWEEIIKDKVLCSALVDRLCHKAHLLWPLFQLHSGGILLYYLQ